MDQIRLPSWENIKKDLNSYNKYYDYETLDSLKRKKHKHEII